MKCRVYPKIKQESERYFKLEQIGTDRIELLAVDNLGHPLTRGRILQISRNGIYLCSNVSASVGLPLDTQKRVPITNY